MQASARIFSTAARRVTINNQNIGQFTQKVSKFVNSKSKQFENIYNFYFDQSLTIGAGVGTIVGATLGIHSIHKYDNLPNALSKTFICTAGGCGAGVVGGIAWPVTAPLTVLTIIRYGLVKL